MADNLEPVDAGQHHVKDKQVKRPIPSQPERICPVLLGGHLKAEEAQ
jgi:hypothetical protein